MTPWACGLRGCDADFGAAAELIRHQARAHDTRECEVCGAAVPAGFLAIRHAFKEHTRAEYLRAYDADSDDIRVRENLLDAVEAEVEDLPAVLDGIEAGGEAVPSVGD
ncbi:MAG: hypothetical protein ABEI39_00610 [Halobacteriales archaeon]